MNKWGPAEPKKISVQFLLKLSRQYSLLGFNCIKKAFCKYSFYCSPCDSIHYQNNLLLNFGLLMLSCFRRHKIIFLLLLLCHNQFDICKNVEFLLGLKTAVNTPVGCTFSMSSLYEKSVVLGPWTSVLNSEAK